MKNINEIIGNNIKELRKINKLTQFDLADKLNYSNKTISRWESGEIIPDVQTINKLSEIFEVPISKMFEPDISTRYKLGRRYRLQIGNKLAISLLFVLGVWLLALMTFINYNINYDKIVWQVFIWAIPISTIVGIIFNTLWGKKVYNYILYTLLNWSLITSLYLSIYNYTFWMLFLVGIPIQIGIILCYNIFKNKEKQRRNLE